MFASTKPPPPAVFPTKLRRPHPSSTATSTTLWYPPSMEPITSAYLHLPFCRRRCHYCDFAISLVGDDAESHIALQGMRRYVDFLIREIALTPYSSSTCDFEGGDQPPLRTVFFGGGTPSLLPPDLLGSVIEALRERFGIDPDAEISMEMDPGTFDAEKLTQYVDLGVNRVSLGLQSFDADVLKWAGRGHALEQSREAIAAVRANRGVERWSLDLISGMPGLTKKAWSDSLKEAVDVAPHHISVYDLQVEEGTLFGSWYNASRFGENGTNKTMVSNLNSHMARPELPSEDESAEMFHMASKTLRDAGYEHYEVSSYAKVGSRCAHNQVYWTGRQGWYGFGMSATSFTAHGKQFARPRKMRDYEAYVEAMAAFIDEPSRARTIKSSFEARAEALLERLMLGLRTRNGVDLVHLRQDFGDAVLAEIVSAVRAGWPEELVEMDDYRLTLSDPGGMLVSTQLISTLMARVSSLHTP